MKTMILSQWPIENYINLILEFRLQRSGQFEVVVSCLMSATISLGFLSGSKVPMRN
ncbi:hypothetical protein QJS10_CPA09g00718 [Acorus calamus]|uniref:Uncharacterized protein n=1 Tax=Acorus calamus TaxID=4465 RepID=A0AAV9E8U5_ACOCL|nr:hypothetical protein QJS10_CPA09g00718 [Acorus calamus]